MLLLVIAAAVQSVTPPSSAAAPAAPPSLAAAAKVKKVCQLEEDVTSRIRYKKVCLPQSEWDAIAKATQADLEGSRNNRRLPPPQ